jgi:hypothetical protein
MTAKLTFYGGVNEIGGNKILLQTEAVSVLLDFGRKMSEYSKFFSEFLVARSKNALRDMTRLGILPKIDGIYTPTLVDTTLLFENEDVTQKIPLKEALELENNPNQKSKKLHIQKMGWDNFGNTHHYKEQKSRYSFLSNFQESNFSYILFGVN